MTGLWHALSPLAVTRPSASGPLIGRRAARILARRELDHVSIGERILRAIEKFLGLGSSAVPSGWFGLVTLGVLAVVLIVVVLTWTRPARTRRRKTGAVLTDRALTAREYRQRSRQLAESGDYGEAIVEGVRAIAAELDERGILAPRVGRTAYELAIEAGAELPALAADLRGVTGLFDDVRYGDLPGTQTGYELVSRVDASVQAARAGASEARLPAAPGPAVPR